MGIKFVHKGNFVKTTTFLRQSQDWSRYEAILKQFGDIGVEALRESTPRDSGVTAESWDYVIKADKYGASIKWVNNSFTDEKHHIPIVILLQYGHGTRNGGFVEGRDFINPAMMPVFEQMVHWFDTHWLG